VDRVGGRRAPRVRRAKAGAKALLRDRKRRARLLPGRALPHAAGEPEPKLKTGMAEEAGRARAALAADEVEQRGADRGRAGRRRARAGAERAPVEAAARRALGNSGPTTNRKGVPPGYRGTPFPRSARRLVAGAAAEAY
jgi:hypothetical protein